MTPEEQERLAKVRSDLAKERALKLEKERHENRAQLEKKRLQNKAELAVIKSQEIISKQESKDGAIYDLEVLKAQLQPEQLTNLQSLSKSLCFWSSNYNTTNEENKN